HWLGLRWSLDGERCFLVCLGLRSEDLLVEEVLHCPLGVCGLRHRPSPPPLPLRHPANAGTESGCVPRGSASSVARGGSTVALARSRSDAGRPPRGPATSGPS